MLVQCRSTEAVKLRLPMILYSAGHCVTHIQPPSFKSILICLFFFPLKVYKVETLRQMLDLKTKHISLYKGK